MTASADAARFLAEMYQFAERLAGRGLVVRSLRSDWGSFGSWMIEASAGDAEDRREAAIPIRRVRSRRSRCCPG
jgi:hypothetical protein